MQKSDKFETMRISIILLFFLTLSACTEPGDVAYCPPSNRVGAYQLEGIVAREGYRLHVNHADITWHADSTALVKLLKDSCGIYMNLSLNDLNPGDTLWLTERLVPATIRYSQADGDAVVPPLSNAACPMCYVWFNRTAEDTYLVKGSFNMKYDGAPLSPEISFEVDVMLHK